MLKLVQNVFCSPGKPGGIIKDRWALQIYPLTPLWLSCRTSETFSLKAHHEWPEKNVSNIENLIEMKKCTNEVYEIYKFAQIHQHKIELNVILHEIYANFMFLIQIYVLINGWVGRLYVYIWIVPTFIHAFILFQFRETKHWTYVSALNGKAKLLFNKIKCDMKYMILCSLSRVNPCVLQRIAEKWKMMWCPVVSLDRICIWV